MEDTAAELETTLKRVEKEMRLNKKLEKVMDKYVPPGVPAEEEGKLDKKAFVPPQQLGQLPPAAPADGSGMPPMGMPPADGSGMPPMGMPPAGGTGMPPAGAPPSGMPPAGMQPQLPPGLQMDPNTGLLVDTTTGVYIDPNTGMPIDPATGQPIVPPGSDPSASQAPPVAPPAELADAEPAPTEDFERRLSTVEKGLNKVLELLEQQQGGEEQPSMGGPADSSYTPPANPAAMASPDGLDEMRGPYGPQADEVLAGMSADKVGTLAGFSQAVKDAQRRKQQAQGE